jgi:hypothetical protein
MAASKDSSLFPSDFAWLAQGRSLGKKVQLLIDPDDSGSLQNPPNVNVLELQGPDEAAMNVQLTINPPLIIDVPTPEITLARARALVDQQSASGSIDNLSNELLVGGFPGAVTYTPMIAILDWGIGGVAVKGVEVDIANGLNINLTCSYLRVNVASDPLMQFISDHPVGSSAIYELAAFVGPGYAKRNNAQRTVHVRRFGIPESLPFSPAISNVVPIPKFATRVSLQLGQGVFSDPDDMRGWYCQIIFLRTPAWGFGTGTALFVSDHSLGIVEARGDECCQFMIPNGALYCYLRTTFSPGSFPPFGMDVYPSLIFDLGI